MEKNNIGKTRKTCKQKNSEHIRDVKNSDTTVNETDYHCWKFENKFDWEKNTIIDKKYNRVSREVKETMNSVKDKNHMNNISYALTSIWLQTLQQHKQQGLFHLRPKIQSFLPQSKYN